MKILAITAALWYEQLRMVGDLCIQRTYVTANKVNAIFLHPWRNLSLAVGYRLSVTI